MPYTLSLVDAESRDLVVAALVAEADRRTRTAERISAVVRADKRAGEDVRPSAVKVTTLLGEAAELRAAGGMLAAAQDVVLVSTSHAREVLGIPPIVDAATGAPADPVLPGLEDDGTSPEAQAIADLAGLTGYNPDEDPVDVDTMPLGETATP